MRPISLMCGAFLALAFAAAPLASQVVPPWQYLGSTRFFALSVDTAHVVAESSWVRVRIRMDLFEPRRVADRVFRRTDAIFDLECGRRRDRGIAAESFDPTGRSYGLDSLPKPVWEDFDSHAEMRVYYDKICTVLHAAGKS